MAGTIRITTDQVEAIAAGLENNNNKLRNTLEESLATIKSMNSFWEGEAAQTTIGAFETFASTYYQTYYEVIKAYVTFLRMNVANDYVATENANTSLADLFK